MTVNVLLKGHDFKISERLEDYITNKASKLDRYLPELSDVLVELTNHEAARSANDRNVTQITLRSTRGTILRAEESAADMFAAFDTTLEKIQRQIERYKGKRTRRRGTAAGADKVTDHLADAEAALDPNLLVEDDAADLFDGQIVREKHFITVPMTPAEALEQMQMLGHENFFIFFNADDSKLNVIYRRRDGTYGLLIPELG